MPCHPSILIAVSLLTLSCGGDKSSTDSGCYGGFIRDELGNCVTDAGTTDADAGTTDADAGTPDAHVVAETAALAAL
jgi:hypothetical protein